MPAPETPQKKTTPSAKPRRAGVDLEPALAGEAVLEDELVEGKGQGVAGLAALGRLGQEERAPPQRVVDQQRLVGRAPGQRLAKKVEAVPAVAVDAPESARVEELRAGRGDGRRVLHDAKGDVGAARRA